MFFSTTKTGVKDTFLENPSLNNKVPRVVLVFYQQIKISIKFFDCLSFPSKKLFSGFSINLPFPVCISNETICQLFSPTYILDLSITDLVSYSFWVVLSLFKTYCFITKFTPTASINYLINSLWFREFSNYLYNSSHSFGAFWKCFVFPFSLPDMYISGF